MFIELLCVMLPTITGKSSQTPATPGDLTVGITLNCPYGLGTCYPDIRTALKRLPGLEVLSELADPNTWTCKLRMTGSKILKPTEFQAYLASLHLGANLRGIEATIYGHLEAGSEGKIYLVSRDSRLPLEALADTVYWDVKKKRSKALLQSEKEAYSELMAVGRPGDKVIVTGVLKQSTDSGVPSLEVRTFNELSIAEAAAEGGPNVEELFAPVTVQQDSTEIPQFGQESMAAMQPSSGGSWSTVQIVARPGIHSHLLPTGEILLNGVDTTMVGYSANGASKMLATEPYNTFCSGHTLMSDGRVMFAGGTGPTTGAGDDRAAIYDPFTNSWSMLPTMNAMRWYPTVVQLANNQMLVLSGTVGMDLSQKGNTPQIWTGSEWVYLTGARRWLVQYPNVYLAPDGRVFVAGPDQQTLYLNTTGLGSWSNGPMRKFASRAYGPTVEYEPGKILFIGGGDPPTATTEAIDLTAAKPAWTPMASMNYPRHQHNGTVLPDGTVLVNGGTYSTLFDDPTKPVNQAELWNPITNTWTVMASQRQYRGYHSTSILLPDGRVWTSGGTGESDVEIYSPPYLSNGPRPIVLAQPTTIQSGKVFSLGAAIQPISKISLIRLSSTTHTLNHDESFQWLPFTAGKLGISVTAPTISPLTPGGYYMLFVLNAKGVPSVGCIVHLVPQSGAGAASPN
jgi:hypothetical protein